MKRDYYTVFWDNCEGATYATAKEAIGDIANEMDYWIEGNYGLNTGTFEIKIKQMTPEEYAAMPEFQGY
jgi:hypothetical protein